MAAASQPAAGAPAEGRREAILDATLRVIAAGGADEVTHRRVAAEARVPLGSTTYYFASRDELVREAFRHYVGKVFALLGEVQRDFPRLTASDIVELLSEVARRELADPAAMLIEYELIVRAARDETLAAAFNDYEHALEAQLAEKLERLGAARPFDGARTLIALVRGFELRRLTRPDTDVGDLRRRLQAVIGAVIGVTAPARRPGRPRHDRSTAARRRAARRESKT